MAPMRLCGQDGSEWEGWGGEAEWRKKVKLKLWGHAGVTG